LNKGENGVLEFVRAGEKWGGLGKTTIPPTDALNKSWGPRGRPGLGKSRLKNPRGGKTSAPTGASIVGPAERKRKVVNEAPICLVGGVKRGEAPVYTGQKFGKNAKTVPFRSKRDDKNKKRKKN